MGDVACFLILLLIDELDDTLRSFLNFGGGATVDVRTRRWKSIQRRRFDGTKAVTRGYLRYAATIHAKI